MRKAQASSHLSPVIGAPEWTRTTTPFRAQALNLLRIPFRHGGMPASIRAPHPEVYTRVYAMSTFIGCQRHSFRTVIYEFRVLYRCDWADGSERAIPDAKIPPQRGH
jgi:hypothetical protein